MAKPKSKPTRKRAPKKRTAEHEIDVLATFLLEEVPGAFQPGADESAVASAIRCFRELRFDLEAARNQNKMILRAGVAALAQQTGGLMTVDTAAAAVATYLDACVKSGVPPIPGPRRSAVIG